MCLFSWMVYIFAEVWALTEHSRWTDAHLDYRDEQQVTFRVRGASAAQVCFHFGNFWSLCNSLFRKCPVTDSLAF